MTTRLHSVDQELADTLLAARLDALRSSTTAACAAVLPFLADRDGALRRALEDLRSTERCSKDMCAALRGLAEQLDDEYFELVEASDGGNASPEVVSAFSRARFVSALAFACEGTRLSYVEAIYELQAATDSWDAIRSVIVNALS